MEIKVGILYSNKEFVVESQVSIEELQREIATAGEKVISFSEPGGNTVLIPGKNIAYVEISKGQPRPIGFGAV